MCTTSFKISQQCFESMDVWLIMGTCGASRSGDNDSHVVGHLDTSRRQPLSNAILNLDT